jgi:hypothetical protein
MSSRTHILRLLPQSNKQHPKRCVPFSSPLKPMHQQQSGYSIGVYPVAMCRDPRVHELETTAPSYEKFRSLSMLARGGSKLERTPTPYLADLQDDSWQGGQTARMRGTVKELLGYSDITMTMRYAHPSQKTRRKAVDVLLIQKRSRLSVAHGEKVAYGSETQVIEKMVPPRRFERPTNGLGRRRRTRKQLADFLGNGVSTPSSRSSR